MTSTGYLSHYIKKLSHPLTEIRERSLQLLIAKLRLGWEIDDELSGTRELLETLLAWFHVQKPTLQREALQLLLRTIMTKAGNYIVKEYGVKRLLTKLDAVRHKLDQDARDTYRELIESIQFFNTVEEGNNVDVPRLTLPSVTSEESDGDSNRGYLTSLRNDYQSSRGDSISNEGTINVSKDTNCIRLLLFPWVLLTSSDSKTVLLVEDALKLLKSTRRCCRFICDVFLRDFPPEIFLNRPSIVQNLLLMSDTGQGGRPNETLFVLLCITRALNKRIFELSSVDLINDAYKITDSKETDERVNTELQELAGDSSPDLQRQDDTLAALRQWPAPLFALEATHAVLTIMARSIVLIDPEDKSEVLDVKTLNTCLDLVEALIQLLLECVDESFWSSDHPAKTHRDIAHKSCMVMRLLGDLLTKYKKSCTNYPEMSHHRVAWFRLVWCAEKLLRWARRSALPPSSLLVALQTAQLDPALELFYPSLSEDLCEVLQNTKISTSNEFKTKYRELSKLVEGMEAAVKFMKSKNSCRSTKQVLKIIKKSLPVIEVHLNEAYLDEVADVLLKKATYMDLNNEDWTLARNIALNLMAHNVKWVAIKFYKQVADMVKSVLVDEDINQVDNEKCLILLCDVSILTEICCHGMSSNIKEIERSASDIMLYLLRGRMVLSEGCWWRLLASLLPALPLLHVYAAHDTEIGQAICKSLEPEIAECMGVSASENVMGLVRLLFVQCVSVRLEAAHAFCRLLGDPKYLPPRESLRTDVLLNALRRVQPQNFNVDFSSSPSRNHQATSISQMLDVLKQDIVLDEHGVECVPRASLQPTLEPSLRRSTLQQLAALLRQQAAHDAFLRCAPLHLVVAVLRQAISLDYPRRRVECVPRASLQPTLEPSLRRSTLQQLAALLRQQAAHDAFLRCAPLHLVVAVLRQAISLDYPRRRVECVPRASLQPTLEPSLRRSTLQQLAALLRQQAAHDAFLRCAPLHLVVAVLRQAISLDYPRRRVECVPRASLQPTLEPSLRRSTLQQLAALLRQQAAHDAFLRCAPLHLVVAVLRQAISLDYPRRRVECVPRASLQPTLEPSLRRSTLQQLAALLRQQAAHDAFLRCAPLHLVVAVLRQAISLDYPRRRVECVPRASLQPTLEPSLRRSTLQQLAELLRQQAAHDAFLRCAPLHLVVAVLRQAISLDYPRRRVECVPRASLQPTLEPSLRRSTLQQLAALLRQQAAHDAFLRCAPLHLVVAVLRQAISLDYPRRRVECVPRASLQPTLEPSLRRSTLQQLAELLRQQAAHDAFLRCAPLHLVVAVLRQAISLDYPRRRVECVPRASLQPTLEPSLRRSTLQQLAELLRQQAAHDAFLRCAPLHLVVAVLRQAISLDYPRRRVECVPRASLQPTLEPSLRRSTLQQLAELLRQQAAELLRQQAAHDAFLRCAPLHLVVAVLRQAISLDYPRRRVECVPRASLQPTLEPSLRRSTLQQLAALLRQQAAHDAFLRCAPLHLVVAVLRQAISLDYPRRRVECVPRASLQPTLEPSLRRSTLQQLAALLRQQAAHDAFLRCAPLHLVVAVLRMSLMVDDYLAFPECAISCVSILNSVCFASRHILAKVHDLPALLIRVILLFPANDSAVLMAAQVLALIGWSGFALQELDANRCQVPALPLSVVDRTTLPYIANTYWSISPNAEHSIVEWLLSDSDWRASVRVRWWCAWESPSRVLKGAPPPPAPLALRPTGDDLLLLQTASPMHEATKALLALENATSHKQVNEALNILESYVHLVKWSPECVDFGALPWPHMRRFLCAPPASPRDTALLIALLHFIVTYMDNVPTEGGAHLWIKSCFLDKDTSVIALLSRDRLFPQQTPQDSIEITQLHIYIIKVLLRCVVLLEFVDDFDSSRLESLIKILLACLERVDLRNFHMLGYLNELMRCIRYALNSRYCKLSENTLIDCLELVTRTLRGCAAGGGRKGRSCRLDAMLSVLAMLRQIHEEGIPVQRWSEAWSGDAARCVAACAGCAGASLRAAALRVIAQLARYTQLAPQLLQAIPSESMAQYAVSIFSNEREASAVRAAAASLLTVVASRPSLYTDVLESEILQQLQEYNFLESCIEIFVEFLNETKHQNQIEPNVPLSLLERRSELEVRAEKCADVHISPSIGASRRAPTAGLVAALAGALHNVAGFERCPVQAWNDQGLYRLLFRCASWSNDSPSDTSRVRAAACRALVAAAPYKCVRSSLSATKDCLHNLMVTLMPLDDDELNADAFSARTQALLLLGSLLPDRSTGDSVWTQLRTESATTFFSLLLQCLDSDVAEFQDAGLFCLTQLSQSAASRKHPDKATDDACLQLLDNMKALRFDSRDLRSGDANDCQPEYLAEQLCRSLMQIYQNMALQGNVHKSSQDERWCRLCSCLACLLSASGRARLYSVHRQFARALLATFQNVRDQLSMLGQPVEVIRNANTNPTLRTLYWLLTLISCLMTDCLPAKESLAEDNLALSLNRLWPWCMMTAPLREAAVHLLMTFTNNCPKACGSMCMCVGGRSLLLECCALLCHETAAASRAHSELALLACARILRHTVDHHHCRAVILKSEALPSLHKMRARARSGALTRQWGALCCALARHADGAAAVLALRPRAAPLPAAARAACHAAVRPVFLNDPELLEMLTGSLLTGDIADIVAAARAVWALAANNHKAKLLLRSARVPLAVQAAQQRLQRSAHPAAARALQLVAYTRSVLHTA